jgi:hypothetical protein
MKMSGIFILTENALQNVHNFKFCVQNLKLQYS